MFSKYELKYRCKNNTEHYGGVIFEKKTKLDARQVVPN